MSQPKHAWIFCLAFFISVQVSAVSRVGGGRVRSQSSGFEMVLPADYVKVDMLGANSVLARGPMIYRGHGGFEETYIHVREFSTDFGDMADFKRTEVEDRFRQSGWVPVDMGYPCVTGFKNINGRVISYAATWGEAKGFVLNAPNFNATDRSMQEMLATLQIDPGSCAWK